MKLDKQTVKYISDLARVELNESEIEYFLPQLEKILDYIEKINQADLEKIKPIVSFSDNRDIYREDEVKVFENQQGILNNFPQKEDNFIKVPKVIE